MAEHGFLFLDPLARRIAQGTKKVTRRPITMRNSLPDGDRWSDRHADWGEWTDIDWSLASIDGAGTNDGYLKVGFKNGDGAIARLRCTVVSADVLVAREAWRVSTYSPHHRSASIAYRADSSKREATYPSTVVEAELVKWARLRKNGSLAWTPSLLMPHWAARSVRSIVSIHPEQLDPLSQLEAEAEGFDSPTAFANGWDAAYTAKGLAMASRPWVWVTRFADRNEPTRSLTT